MSAFVLGGQMKLPPTLVGGIRKLLVHLIGWNSTIHPLSWVGFPTLGKRRRIEASPSSPKLDSAGTCLTAEQILYLTKNFIKISELVRGCFSRLGNRLQCWQVLLMKQCPKCRLTFADGNLRFCRFDGSSLINKATPPHEAATILFSSSHLNDQFTPLKEQHRESESGKPSDKRT